MKVVVSDNMNPGALEKVKETGAEVIYKPDSLEDAVSDAEVLVVRSATKVTEGLLSKAPKLKAVIRGGVGLDNIDQDACRKRGVEVANTPGASTNAVAELALGLAIATSRNIQKAHLSMKEGKWEKKSLSGTELHGKTFGLIGCGRIGTLTGEKAHRLGMKVVGYNPPPRHVSSFMEYVELDELFRNADIISLHVPLNQNTEKMINTESISKMKEGVIIINTARGQIIDEDALYDACKSGKVRAAALDVYCEEPYKGKLLELDNVFFTPHIGAATQEAQLRIGEEIASKIRSLMD
ncbi:3-phosphoglycerate dehydrogenase [Candidatus Micrarchaeota archaeon]|nr:3-phosphoglycerate dehydrogenase [Candidatus Micrarchaeota archaeon]MBD3417770.1 3-phosphoglycerate dehydrogenase [Candidatus Micrarchaeota archaeon]